MAKSNKAGRKNSTTHSKKNIVRVALVVPHIFINRDVMDDVIFSPGQLALNLAENLGQHNIDVTLFTPGTTNTKSKNITTDMSGFKRELAGRGYGYIELLKKHPLVFISLARQVQAEIIAKAYKMANDGDFDVVHIYTNEEDTALHFAEFCKKPVVFTHHDPYNFLIKYKAVLPKYRHLNFISMSMSQRDQMPVDTNWVANIYHGLDPDNFRPNYKSGEYFAYLGRIIEPKGVHLAVQAIKKYNLNNSNSKVKLKIAGKHYSGNGKDNYWLEQIAPHLNQEIEYVGHLTDDKKIEFLRHAKALIVPSLFNEPFGMVTIEALASGTPVIGLDHGATPEIIEHGHNGFIAEEDKIADYLDRIDEIDRQICRQTFEEKFTLDRMTHEHAELYKKLVKKN